MSSETTPVTVEPITGAPPRGTLVAVMAAKGGCGATLLAVNLAAALAERGRTCLLDLDFCKGDVAGVLDLKSGRTINLLLERVHALDDALLRGAVEVLPGGLAVLAQPYDLTDLRQPALDEVRAVLGLVRGEYGDVVADVGSRVDVATLCTATAADHVLVVTTPDLMGLRDAQRVLGLLRRLDVPAERIHLIVNKAGRGAIPDEEIQAQLGVPVALDLPRDDAACARADQAGLPLIEIAPHAALARDVAQLVALVRGDLAAAPDRGRFAWLRGR